MMNHGTPCWYELVTADLDRAEAFYGEVLGWTVSPFGMEGVDYRVATAPDGISVAGITGGGGPGSGPPGWTISFVADDVDVTTAAMVADGASAIVPPTDMPDVGRFSTIADPHGAVFGLLQPLPPESPDQSDGSVADQNAAGHGNWHELMSADPAAGLAFYAKHFGWTAGEAMDMGEMGTYQLFQHLGADIGGMMGLDDAPMSCWMTYFGVPSTEAAIGRITAGGGSVHHGPAEVPGGAFIAVAQDDQGAWFAVIGPA